MSTEPTDISLDQWIERVRTALGAADPGIDLGPEERDAILDLARVAARGSERIAAPLTAFIVGAAFRDMAHPARTEHIQALTKALEVGG